MKIIVVINIILAALCSQAQPLSTEESIKRILYLAQPFSTVQMSGRNVIVSMYAFDRYPVTDTAFYTDWEGTVTGVIHWYLPDSSFDNIVYWVYPQLERDPNKAFVLYFRVDDHRKPVTTASERLEALLSILPIESHIITKGDIITVELFDKSVKYRPALQQYFGSYNSYLKYRTTLASVFIDFVLDKRYALYKRIQVRNTREGEVTLSETYDVKCGLMEHALKQKF